VKFLIHSNGPTISTGYGVQTALLADRLAGAGHEVAVSCTYGHQGPISTWTSPSGHKIRLYPMGYETNGNDVIHMHADHFFGGDASTGWIIPLMDVWSLPNPLLAEFQVAAWAPVDHLPAPPGVLAFFHRNPDAIPVAMSRFGERMFAEADLDPTYIPLAVDTKAYKPTFTLQIGGDPVDARTVFDLPQDAFVVGMVAMNKGWARDRKGFNEAFRAFGQFRRTHPNAVLFVHSEKFGAAEGVDLVELARHAAIPDHAIVFSDQYAYRLGMPPEMMAAAYTAMDVLLCPSHGEGFGVPMIEAQACGTPVIASDFSSQRELTGAGWSVSGQLEMDSSQHASYICPFISDVVAKLEEAYNSDLTAMQSQAIEFAAAYDADRVFEEYWLPFIATLIPAEPVVKPKLKHVDILVPLVRDTNRKRFQDSLTATTPRGKVSVIEGEADKSYAENVNALLAKSSADWVLIVGDDTEFTPGWFNAAREASMTADVIGTNDSEPGRIRNPDVAAGRHADHFLVRREYIDEEGASLDGPGVLMPEAYGHWWVDKEVIGLAKARGVFVFAEDCRIIHHHPGYDGNEAAREADPIYMKAIETKDADRKTFMERAPLIEGHRVTRVGR
jgi:glycosyltransferase involved in cell wall biosynthesis